MGSRPFDLVSESDRKTEESENRCVLTKKPKEKKRSLAPCFAFQQGTCTRGDACKFSHVLIAPAKSDSADDVEEEAAKPASPSEQQQSGSRWVGGVSAAGKRQRKFF